MRQWAERIYDYRASAAIVIAFLTAYFAWQAQHLIVATQFRDLYPTDHPHIKLSDKYPQFGSPLLVFLVIQVKKGTIYNSQTLAKIQAATRQVDLIPGVDHNRIFSIASPKTSHVEATVGGIQVTNFLVGPIPQSDRDLERFRNKIRSAPEIMGVLVSPQEDAALIQAGFLERLADYSVIFHRINRISSELRDDQHDIYAAGQPILSGWVHFYRHETLLIFTATLAAMILLLALYVRNVPGVVTPIIVSATTAIWGLGIATLFTVSLDPLIMVLPMLLIARSFSHAIQAGERYFEIYSKTQNQREACIGSMVSLFPPGILGILTDAAGLFLVGMAPIPIMEKVAIISGFWALSLIPADVVFTPIVLSFLPPPRNALVVIEPGPHERTVSARSLFSRTLEFLAYWGFGKRAWMTATTLAILLVWCGIHARQLTLGDNHPGTALLWPDSEYNSAVKKINERFAGFDLLQVVLESSEPQLSMRSPQALDLMQRFQRYMEADPEVGATFSFADLVAATNRLLHDGLPKWDIIPNNERDAAMLAQLALSGAGPGDSEYLFTRDLSAASLNVWYKDHKSATIERALNRTKAFESTQPADETKALRLHPASGSIGLSAAINETVARAQVRILLVVIAVIFALCSIAYRSFVAAALLLIPVNFSNFVAAGLMGYLDIGLDVNTLPVLAVGTGVGIDYAIYLMSRICEEFSSFGDYESILSRAIATTGRAILFTAGTLFLGMVPWYFLSSLRFQANMGLLIAALMIINMIAALVILPLLVAIFKPKFISRRALFASSEEATRAR